MDIPDGIIIREFAKGDRQLVVDFFDQMGGETRGFFNQGDFNRKRVLRFFDGDAGDQVFFLAEKDGSMAGLVFLYDTHKKVPWLGIAVSEGMKGKRLGGQLIQAAKAYARTHNMGGIMLTTSVANHRGQGL